MISLEAFQHKLGNASGKLPDLVLNTSVASFEDLIYKDDTTHFDGPSAQEMGRRIAAQMLKLQPS